MTEREEAIRRFSARSNIKVDHNSGNKYTSDEAIQLCDKLTAEIEQMMTTDATGNSIISTVGMYDLIPDLIDYKVEEKENFRQALKHISEAEYEMQDKVIQYIAKKYCGK